MRAVAPRWLALAGAAMVMAAPAFARAQSAEPDGAGVERGTLPLSWAEPNADACATTPDFRLHEYNPDFYILRQSGCTNYEKPFLYLVFGNGRALLLDSGAKGAKVADAVRDALQRWADRRAGGRVPALIVAHSHGHGDHVAGDSALRLLANTTVVGTDTGAMRAFWRFGAWPTDAVTYDLGGRMLDVVAIPGHQPASIAVYDRRTGVLLTGDTMYPGRLYVANDSAFRASVTRLVDFTRGKIVAHVLGAHIEQARTPYVDYPIRTKFQPDEHALELSRGNLLELEAALKEMPGPVVRRAFRDFTIWPNRPAAGTRF